MAIRSTQGERFGEAWDALGNMVAGDGSATMPHAVALMQPDAPARDLADAAHCLCMLHGRHPGLLEAALDRATHPVAAAWLAEAAEAFAAERATLVSIIARVGSLPSTPGQAESEAAIAGQRHALDMLVTSDRAGCPLGAAVALVLDWPVFRLTLDIVAARVGHAAAPSFLPNARDSAAVVAELAITPAFDRAMLFGAQQTLAQHRALWQLLEARAAARLRV